MNFYWENKRTKGHLYFHKPRLKKLCYVQDCNMQASRRALCNSHYEKWRRYGNPLIKKRANKGSGCITKAGYIRIGINKKSVMLHRCIMEQHLKRKLRPWPYEIVHHKDGNKQNNNLSNLEIMAQASHNSLHNLRSIRTKTHKTCTQCNQLLPYSNFSHCQGTIDKKRSNCKQCQNKYNQIRFNKATITK